MDDCCSEKSQSGSCENETNIMRTSSKLTLRDVFGSWSARWGINRMNYKVEPGLYSIGKPDSDSPVLVTANYKMSFDALRKKLKGINAWILVLNTMGINVWCAAGKGTFGTSELINRIRSVNLEQVVSHKDLILPQLGAVGVSAHELQRSIGFKVVYGPVRAKDIRRFLKNGMTATTKMRTVRFNFFDRLVLTPMELVGSIKSTLIVFGVLFILNSIKLGDFSSISALAYLGALIVGCVIVPALLPIIPGRAFAWKGWLLGMLWAIGLNLIIGWPQTMSNLMVAIAYILILPAVSAFYAMNFTGASTYASPSGVLKEMKTAVPMIIISICLGAAIFLANGFINV